MGCAPYMQELSCSSHAANNISAIAIVFDHCHSCFQLAYLNVMNNVMAINLLVNTLEINIGHWYMVIEA